MPAFCMTAARARVESNLLSQHGWDGGQKGTPAPHQRSRIVLTGMYIILRGRAPMAPRVFCNTGRLMIWVSYYSLFSARKVSVFVR